MPITVDFKDDNHLVIWRFEGKWTWTDYYSQRDAINNQIEAMPHTVHMIVDMTNGSMLPQNVLSHAGSAARKAPSNIGIIVIVGANAFLRTFFQLFKQLYGVFQPQQEKNLRMTSTLSEAYAIVRNSENTE